MDAAGEPRSGHSGGLQSRAGIEFHSVIDDVGALDNPKPPIAGAGARRSPRDRESLSDVCEITQCVHVVTLPWAQNLSICPRDTLSASNEKAGQRTDEAVQPNGKRNGPQEPDWFFQRCRRENRQGAAKSRARSVCRVRSTRIKKRGQRWKRQSSP